MQYISQMINTHTFEEISSITYVFIYLLIELFK